MILVAFVLVLVATVMLIIGTFFDGGVAYIWISIGACVATFGVLAASYLARRRGADDEGARPQPLGAGESRPAAVGSGPRGTTVPGGGTATRTRPERDTETETDTDVEVVADGAEDEVEGEEPTVTIVPSEDDRQPADLQDEDATDDDATQDEGAPAAEEAPQPAPRRVAPRRVVRRADAATEAAPAEAPVADSGTDAAADAPTWPTGDAQDEEPAVDDQAGDEAASTTSGGTRKVVRRVQSGGTRKVVRRVSSSGGGDGTRKVVRRSGAAQAGGQRTVKRVVRRAPAAGGGTAADTSQKASKPAARSGGTRGKKARAVLSEIKGVGPAKQDALLKRFGSLEDMAEASIGELAAVKGVGEAVAQSIKDSLKGR